MLENPQLSERSQYGSKTQLLLHKFQQPAYNGDVEKKAL
jgi:hypothetical protein